MKRLAGLGLVMLLTLTGIGIGLALIVLAPNVGIALAAMLAIGAGAAFAKVRVIAWLQQRTPAVLRGRVMSLVLLGVVGLDPSRLAVSGAIVDLV
jgi:hypothetical protein